MICNEQETLVSRKWFDSFGKQTVSSPGGYNLVKSVMFLQPFNLKNLERAYLKLFCSKFSLQKLVTKLGWSHLRPPFPRQRTKNSQGFARLNRAGTTASTLTGIPAKRWKLACASKSDPCCFRNSIPRKDVVFSKARWTDSELHLKNT